MTEVFNESEVSVVALESYLNVETGDYITDIKKL
ncbi:uncharacterized protein METZ01_LOCUS344026, partial [marine metagenome]